MRNILLKMQYDGACFHGWQVQQNAYTVQQALQDALQRLFGERPDVKGCSRTDSGVHAQAYCATFRTQKQIACENILRALNTYLPRGICVFDCFEVPDDFHPRYSCLAKQYVYKIYTAPVRSPFFENRALHYPYRLDETFLDREAKAFLGRHDFSGFCSARSDVEDTVREVYRADVVRRGDEVHFIVKANGFLYNMVRIMVGTLLFVAEGKIAPGTLGEVIAAKDRRCCGKTAPPGGLYLNQVEYAPQALQWKEDGV